MSQRLRLAAEGGHIALPEGEAVVLDPHPDTDLSFLEKPRTRVFARSATVRDAFENAGWSAGPVEGPEPAVIVILPRAREAQRAAMRFARDLTEGPVIVDGAKTDGVDAFYRELRTRADVSPAWSKAHGKVFTVAGGDFGDWPERAARRDADGWWRAPGVFSADGVDKASALLAEHLPEAVSGRVVDLGAGWGYLSRAVLDRAGVTHLDMVEDDALALRAAGKNVTDLRAVAHWADARSWRPEAPADHVVTNPPFHTGRAAEPELGQGFIRAAASMLAPRGSLWLVANRQLPYEGTLGEAFRAVSLLTETPSFKVFHAQSPKRR